MLTVAQKIVSKAEGAFVDLREIQPSALARSWAAETKKDERLIELILAQSRRIVKMDRGVLITETHSGLICANAGVDQSNVEGDDLATVLPTDPDASARRLLESLGCGAVVITDTFTGSGAKGWWMLPLAWRVLIPWTIIGDARTATAGSSPAPSSQWPINWQPQSGLVMPEPADALLR